MITAVVGINWGDEGKGRMVDLLCEQYDVICRYQGGNNAGHTVINDKGKFVLNLLPSGILRDGVVNIIGAGTVVDMEHLCGEIDALGAQNVAVTPENLKISSKAFISMPYHRQQDMMEEQRLGDKKYGSTQRGIAPAYGDKVMKKGVRMGDLANVERLEDSLEAISKWKNLTFRGYGANEISLPQIMEWLKKYGERLTPYITDTSEFLENAISDNKNIMFEAQLGALRDIEYGIYPYTTSSQTLAAYAPIGAGIPGTKVDKVIGIVKAYSSCVGEGPFVVEMHGEEADTLRKSGAEYGAATGRPRRVGAFDVPASRYGVRVQGADELAITKLDVLSYMDRIPVCTAYEIDGEKTSRFPDYASLLSAKPVISYHDGFLTDISKCRRKQDLPVAALKYIDYIEKALECPIRYVSVGAGRDDYIMMF